jgi:signal transduction histidine kinase
MVNLPETYYIAHAVIEPIEPIAHLITPFLLISGAIFLFLGYQLELFKWQQKLRHLYVIMSGGTCIYDHDFTFHEIDQDLVTGALTGIIGIIQEVTKKDSNLKVIKQENAIILLEYGKKFTFALLADEELLVLRNKLEIFAKDFETFFEVLFPNFKGGEYKEIAALGNVLIKKSFEK